MCKPRRSNKLEARPATGSTTLLSNSEYVDPNNTARPRMWRPAYFPWWTLWLIWPLIGIGKAVAPAVLDALGSLSQLSVPLLPVVLILIGIVLLLARRRDT